MKETTELKIAVLLVTAGWLLSVVIISQRFGRLEERIRKSEERAELYKESYKKVVDILWGR